MIRCYVRTVSGFSLLLDATDAAVLTFVHFFERIKRACLDESVDVFEHAVVHVVHVEVVLVTHELPHSLCGSRSSRLFVSEADRLGDFRLPAAVFSSCSF